MALPVLSTEQPLRPLLKSHSQFSQGLLIVDSVGIA